MARGRDEAGGWFGASVTTLAVLAFGVGMCWVAAFLYSSVGGGILAPVTAGRWVGAPMLALVVLFAFVGLAAVGGSIFLMWLLALSAWEGRRPRR